MRFQPRNMVLAVIALFTAASAVLIVSSEVEERIDFGTVVKIWGDLVRDVDHIGLTATRVSTRREMEIGRELASGIESRWRIARDSRLQNYVTDVGERLVPYVQRKEIDYRFVVLESAVVNAFAIAGGHIYVTTGMLGFLQTEAELASVLGHEINHVDLRHCIELLQYELVVRKAAGKAIGRLASFGHFLLKLGFSEQQELEADATGMLVAAQAKYDPKAALDSFIRLAKRFPGRAPREKSRTITGELGTAVVDALDQYFETHPRSMERLNQLKRSYIRNANTWQGRQFYTGRSNYQDMSSRSSEERDVEWVGFSRLEDVDGIELEPEPVLKEEKTTKTPQPEEKEPPRPSDEDTPVAESTNKGVAYYERGKKYRSQGNMAKAIKWYKAAALHGEQRGSRDLGDIYRTGQGVPRDGNEAIRWYRLAAKQGDKYSERKLNELSKARYSTKTFIEIKEPDRVFEFGKPKYEVSPGDILEVTDSKTCLSGRGECWEVLNAITGERGYVSAKIMKRRHRIYKE